MYSHKFDRFGFTKIPFCGVPELPFLDSSREKTLKVLKNFLNYRGFAVLCGAPGVGKTMLLNHLSQQLQPNENRIIYIPFAMLKPSDMLKSICIKLNLEPTVSTSKMLLKIQECVSDIQPVNPVLVFDEIQKTDHQTLEIIRLMTNFNFEDKNLFSIILSGNDEFLQQLKLRINEPLRQRVTCFQRLSALSREDTGKYIKHQFKEAGAHQDIITEQAIVLVYNITSGTPRLINSLLLSALEIAGDENDQIIDLKHVNSSNELVSLPTQEVF